MGGNKGETRGGKICLEDLFPSSPIPPSLSQSILKSLSSFKAQLCSCHWSKTLNAFPLAFRLKLSLDFENSRLNIWAPCSHSSLHSPGGKWLAFVTCRQAPLRAAGWPTPGQPTRPSKALGTSARAAFKAVPPGCPGTPARPYPVPENLLGPSTRRESRAGTRLPTVPRTPDPNTHRPGCAARGPGGPAGRRAPSPARLAPRLPEPLPHPAVITTL